MKRGRVLTPTQDSDIKVSRGDKSKAKQQRGIIRLCTGVDFNVPGRQTNDGGGTVAFTALCG